MSEALRRLRLPSPFRTPEGMLVGGFAAAILAATLLLWLPISHNDSVGFLDALFTATSAVCVTGLVVADTGTDYTGFGQAVILLAIQVGGLGVMTFAGLAFTLMGRKLSLQARTSLKDSLVVHNLMDEFRHQFVAILRIVFLFEAVGGVLLFAGFLPHMSVLESAWSALFHSVSAFCNAGFSLNSDSLMVEHANPLVLLTVMALIVTGGLGYPVLVDLKKRARNLWSRAPQDRLTLHTRVVLWTSGILVAAGALLLLVLGMTHEVSGVLDTVGNALFQSITARTAGFNTVSIGALPFASLFVLILLMFIGGSPGSCAGGVKTTTVALWGAALVSRLRGHRTVRILGRYIPADLLIRSSAVLGLAVAWNMAGVLFLSTTEAGDGVGFHDILFEQVSAFATVGLSTGLTGGLSAAGKIWIIATMFVGRLGPLTLVMGMIKQKPDHIRYPEGRVMIG